MEDASYGGFIKSCLIFLIFFSMLSQAQNYNDNMIVMTYNIRYAGDPEKDGINAWENRKENVASIIRFFHADLFGVQEALLNQLRDLQNYFPDHQWVGEGRNGNKEGEFSALFFNSKKFKLLEEETFWLSETPDEPSQGWDGAFPRIVTYAKLEDLRSKKIFYFFNTHFDHVGKEAKINSAELLKKIVSELSEEYPIILSGDFNIKPESETYSILTSFLDDAKLKSKYGHYGNDISFNAFGEFIEEGNRIDYIFVNEKIEVIQHGIIDQKINGNYPSDHMPVVAEIKLK